MTGEPIGSPRVRIVPGRPTVGRLLLCVVAAAGLMTIGFTVAFVMAAAAEMSSPGEVFGVIAAMLLFYAPLSCWTVWSLSVPAIVVVGVAAAAVTHRYRATRRRWRRAGHIGPALLLCVGCWTLILGIADLSYNIK